jgi:hypothetical protein
MSHARVVPPSEESTTLASTVEAVKRAPTPASVWQAVSERRLDDLLDWPPDVFAFTELVLERSEVFRFALSPPSGAEWPPTQPSGWADAVARAGRTWAARGEDGKTPLPGLLTAAWEVVRETSEGSLAELAEGHDWRSCSALLTVHAIADEACAGLGVALTASHGAAAVYHARGRELLARTGSLSRLEPHHLRVLPRIRTSPGGSSSRSISRYAGVHGPEVEARWHKVPAQRSGTEPTARTATFLLLPWPLRVRESDFRPVAGSVRRETREPFAFYEFTPAERLDLDLVDRMLVAARDEAQGVDAVVLPESAIDEDELPALEAVLARHGVACLIAGVRERAAAPGQLPRNCVYVAVSTDDRWVRVRQGKHHRWSLDERQIFQYHLGGALHPHIRWWESMEVPRRAIQLVEVGGGVTLVALVCEDLAQLDDVAELLRSVGPTIVVTPLLDGPQLGSRWAARYASVLADDPGSAVLTLTSLGMAQRSRPPGREASRVIALWRDPVRGTREIALEPGAQGVLLSATADLALRRSSDGRWPVANCVELFDCGVYQVQAAPGGSNTHPPQAARAPLLDVQDVTVLTSWAEAVAEALAFAPEHVDAVLAAAARGAPWRAELGIAEPSPRLSDALCSVERAVRTAMAAAGQVTLPAVLAAVSEGHPNGDELGHLTRHVLRSALEQRLIRQARQAAHADRPPEP